MVLDDYKYEPVSKAKKSLSKSKKETGEYIGIVGLSIGVFCFSMGALTVYPSVILSGSMRPDIEIGDVLLLKKIKDEKIRESIKIEDIIQFEQGEVLVSHRVVDIEEKDGQEIYYTKGDNNTSIDSETVSKNQIKGKIIGVIPKIGWIPLVVRKGLALSK